MPPEQITRNQASAPAQPAHVYIVKQTNYKHGEDDDPQAEDASSILSVHFTVQSANKAAIFHAKDFLSGEWVHVDKHVSLQHGLYRITCRFHADSVHDTDHFVVAVEQHRVTEGQYPDEDAEDDDDDDDDDDDSDEEPAAKRKRW